MLVSVSPWGGMDHWVYSSWKTNRRWKLGATEASPGWSVSCSFFLFSPNSSFLFLVRSLLSFAPVVAPFVSWYPQQRPCIQLSFAFYKSRGNPFIKKKKNHGNQGVRMWERRDKASSLLWLQEGWFNLRLSVWLYILVCMPRWNMCYISFSFSSVWWACIPYTYFVNL